MENLEEVIDTALAATRARQLRASDPTVSAWVAASAGTGKTHVLTMRVVRLLLGGTAPERILCLTYTKAAAAEMSSRVFSQLGQWVIADDAGLAATLEKVLGTKPAPATLALARTLFTRAIETPGGLKVQTIHAFCERLLQRFPLEAGVAPGFSTLDDDLKRRLEREAIDTTLRRALADATGPLGRALEIAVPHAAEDRFDTLLSAALAARPWLDAVLRESTGAGEPPATIACRRLRPRFGVRPDVDDAAIVADLAALLRDDDLQRAIGVLAVGSTNDQKLADKLRLVIAARADGPRIDALSAALLTEKGEPRKDGYITKPTRQREPGVCDSLDRARDRCASLSAERRALACLTATEALLTLATETLQHYADLKARRAALDFDDLITLTASLLRHGEQAQWVLYKLDGGIDHILVDESQDTSPDQWSVIEALAREFFAGEGMSETIRTLFAVGDEKQSIYSFQGAAPEMFAMMGELFASKARLAGQPFDHIPLNLSFRTVAPVLDAVDRIFADPARTPGLGSAAGQIQHIARRLGEAGLVEIWPTEKPSDASPADAFSPLDDTTSRSPVVRLAERIAGTIRGWLDRGETLTSTGRPITPGDILILVRRRAPFAGPMVAALKTHGVPVAGTDRIDLNTQLAVQDLLALGDFVTLPEDDLALACVLKSPLIGLDDDDLVQLAARRAGSLWRALLDQRGDDPRFELAASRLSHWRKRADFSPPFEFFAACLDGDGMRSRLLARMGVEAADSLDEFQSLAMAYDEENPPSLTGFLSWMRTARREIKRDMDQGAGEVRVMTVHASKGLEAPIVFLPDTCAKPGAGPNGNPLVVLDTTEEPDAPDDADDAIGAAAAGHAARVWQVKGASAIPPVAAARQARAEREREELNRLLYVALTRARDRLYITGFEGRKGRDPACWYDIVRDGLTGTAEEVPGPSSGPSRTDPAGTSQTEPILRLSCPQTLASGQPTARRVPDVALPPLPAWAHRPIRPQPATTLPLVPSKLAPYATDDEGDPLAFARAQPPASGKPMPLSVDPNVGAPQERSDPAAADLGELRFLRGSLTHALLQHLPEMAPADRERAARAYVAQRGGGLPAHSLASIVTETLRILDDPQFAALFGPRSRAEVDIVADIPRPGGQGVPLRLNGSIDRLVDTGDAVLILDYKTNRVAPATVADTPEAYLLQLAAYRLALAEIYPGRRIRAALLWTAGPHIHAIPPEMLDLAVAELWTIAGR
ncbi:MAG: double-strand break repair helicase AddA [Hyphomicrobiaceae bacterium]|nr:double-strand break repair helicase AddA [Hyphomicrobiaceae bacterium]